MPFKTHGLPEGHAHKVPAPGGHQDDGEAGGDYPGGGAANGDHAHEGGREPSHDGLERALSQIFFLCLFDAFLESLKPTCKYRVVYIEQDAETKG